MTNYPLNIKNSGLSIYDPINSQDPFLYIPTNELEYILSNSIVGLSLAGLPLRTRSKVVKQELCMALGYPIPNSFKKTQPRFIGQNSSNLISSSKLPIPCLRNAVTVSFIFNIILLISFATSAFFTHSTVL